MLKLIFKKEKKFLIEEDIKDLAVIKDSFFFQSQKGINVCNFLKNFQNQNFEFNIFHINNSHIFLKTIISQLKNFLKGLDQGYFFEFRVYGVGYKSKKSSYKKKIYSLKFDLGYSHFVRLILPKNIFFLRIKKKFLIFSNDKDALNTLNFQIKNLKFINPYKLSGFISTKSSIKLKIGKKQNKR